MKIEVETAADLINQQIYYYTEEKEGWQQIKPK